QPCVRRFHARLEGDVQLLVVRPQRGVGDLEARRRSVGHELGSWIVDEAGLGVRDVAGGRHSEERVYPAARRPRPGTRTTAPGGTVVWLLVHGVMAPTR